MTYRHVEHTADIGIEVRSPNLGELFAEAVIAMTSCVVDIAVVVPSRTLKLQASAGALDLLLIDWLNEALYRFETEDFVPARATAEVSRDADLWLVNGEVLGEILDVRRHRPGTPIKAVTMHGLAVGKENGIWRANVLFDL